jgi:hypothetical protein
MTPADFETLLSHVKDDPFRELLTFAYEAGCRPQEARLIEARHLKLDHHRIEIPPEEAKGKKRWRVPKQPKTFLPTPRHLQSAFAVLTEHYRGARKPFQESPVIKVLHSCIGIAEMSCWGETRARCQSEAMGVCSGMQKSHQLQTPLRTPSGSRMAF